jgi:hypothetical protein
VILQGKFHLEWDTYPAAAVFAVILIDSTAVYNEGARISAELRDPGVDHCNHLNSKLRSNPSPTTKEQVVSQVGSLGVVLERADLP